MNLGAILQHHAGYAAVANEHARDRRARADLRARLPRGRRHGARQRAGPAFHRDAAAARSGIHGGIRKQDTRRPRRPRPLRGAEDAARRDRGLEEVGLEPLGDEIRDRHRSPAQESIPVGPPERAEPPPVFSKSHSSRGLRRVERRGVVSSS